VVLHIKKYGPMYILKNAEQKIAKFNSGISSKVKFYHDVLNAREENKSLVDESGNIGENSLSMIEKALRHYFKMARGGRMGSEEEFIKKLESKLESDKIRRILARLRDVSIVSPNLEDYKSDAEKLYEPLSNCENGLSVDRTGFYVGATKVMHCLFPELFVMLDQNVAKTVLNLRPPQYYNFTQYWKAMNKCRNELMEWQKLYGNTDSLLELDLKPTTLTRIFDKCASTMGK